MRTELYIIVGLWLVDALLRRVYFRKPKEWLESVIRVLLVLGITLKYAETLPYGFAFLMFRPFKTLFLGFLPIRVRKSENNYQQGHHLYFDHIVSTISAPGVRKVTGTTGMGFGGNTGTPTFYVPTSVLDFQIDREFSPKGDVFYLKQYSWRSYFPIRVKAWRMETNYPLNEEFIY